MNIIECVKKYGDISLEEAPLSEVDSLILSALAYLDFSGIAEERGFFLPLGELIKNAEKLTMNSVHPRELLLLINEISKSLRYSSLIAGYYSEINDDSLPERFAAISFLLPDGSVYVAFRGTDITLAAWHEDFSLLYQNVIPSQTDAAKYLACLMEEQERSFFVGGHSKGGNLAVYAASLAEPENRMRIKRIFDHDGPGFHEDFFRTKGYLSVCDRIEKTVPHDSLIGMLLRHMTRFRVVKSKKTLLGQHNPFEWEVENLFSFKTLPNITPISRKAERAIDEFVTGMNLCERRMFVNALFFVIGASGAVTALDLKRKRWSAFLKMRRAFHTLSDKEQELVKKGGKLLIKIKLRAVGRPKGKFSAPL